MAAILHLLPPGVRIVTVEGPQVLRGLDSNIPSPPAPLPKRERGSRGPSPRSGRGEKENATWSTRSATGTGTATLGKSRDPICLAHRPRAAVASCLHADTLDEFAGILASRAAGRDARGTWPRRADPLHARRPLAKRLSPPRGDVATRPTPAATIGSSSLGTPSPTRSSRPTHTREPKGLRAGYEHFIRELVDEGDPDVASVPRKVLAFYGHAEP